MTINELQIFLNSDEVHGSLAAMDLDASDAYMLFTLIDTAKKDIINIDEFTMGCMKLAGGAKGLDLAMLLSYSQWTMSKLKDLCDYTTAELGILHSAVAPGVPITNIPQVFEESAGSSPRR